MKINWLVWYLRCFVSYCTYCFPLWCNSMHVGTYCYLRRFVRKHSIYIYIENRTVNSSEILSLLYNTTSHPRREQTLRSKLVSLVCEEMTKIHPRCSPKLVWTKYWPSGNRYFREANLKATFVWLGVLCAL